MMFLGKERRQRPAPYYYKGLAGWGIPALNLSAVRLRPIYIPPPIPLASSTS